MTIYVANATITYTAPASTVVNYSEIGQPIFDEVGAVTETLDLSLEQRSTEPDIKAHGGKDIQGLYVTGRILSIGTPIPAWLTSDSTFDITWNDGRIGKLYIISSVTSRFNLQTVFGERIQGYYYESSTSS
jgi:hypothetical protein